MVTVARERHALNGPSTRLDPRFHPVRPDLTDIRLADRVFAPHYAMPMPRTALASTPLRSGPGFDAPIISELLPGDGFELLELGNQLAWGLSLRDGLVGYADSSVLDDAATPTHRVIAGDAQLREAPDGNATVLAAWPMGAHFTALGERGDFLLCDHGYVARSAVLPLDTPFAGGVTGAALALVGAPARAGGRSGGGVDGEGLVFLTHDLCGIAVPRLRDGLAAALAPVANQAPPVSGDVLVFADHLAIAVDGGDAVHVEGQVRREPLTALVARFGAPVAWGRIG